MIQYDFKVDCADVACFFSQSDHENFLMLFTSKNARPEIPGK